METKINDRVLAARTYFGQGYNCAQSVAMAYADVLKMDAESVGRLSIAFGGGFGRQREVCGAVLGGGMVLGAVCHTPITSTHTAKTEVYGVVQLFSEQFKEQNGSIICRELLGLAKGEACNPTPAERTMTYYRRRPCAEYVAEAAKLVGEILLDSGISI